MENLNKYGSQPYDIILLHGGPGAPGSLDSIARRLSISFSIIEPAILSLTINGQLAEINSYLNGNSGKQIYFVGHSWGAWLAMLYAAEFPQLVKKIIIIGTPPLEAAAASLVRERRLAKLSEKEKEDFSIYEKQLYMVSDEIHSLSPELVSLLNKTDIFEPLQNESLSSVFYPEVFKKIWAEALQLRHSGELLNLVKNVRCPVVAIHGDSDPHPAEGVSVALSAILPEFRFCLIEKCGHYPWKEKYGKDILYKIFYKEMGSTCV